MGVAVLNKPLIQFSVEEWGYVPSLLFDLRPNHGGGNEDNGDFLQKVTCTHCYTQCLQPGNRPLAANASVRDSWTLTGKLGHSLVGSLPLSSGPWCTQGSVCALPESASPVLCKFWQVYGHDNGLLLQFEKRAYAIPRS